MMKFDKAEEWRRHGGFGLPPTKRGDPYGWFELPWAGGITIMVIACAASKKVAWDHASVTVSQKRCPTWPEMCLVKNLFWDDEDCVVQFHPPASQYVNHHPYCLHLWRKLGDNVETPPTWTIA